MTAAAVAGTIAPASARPATAALAHHTPATSAWSASANKALVSYFYDQLFNHDNLTIVDQFVRPDYIQHNPTAPDGPAAAKTHQVHGASASHARARWGCAPGGRSRLPR